MGTKLRILQPTMQITSTGYLRLRNDRVENILLDDKEYEVIMLKEEAKKLYSKGLFR